MTILISIPWFHPAYKAGGPIQSISNMVEQFHQDVTYNIFTSDIDLDGTKLNVTADSWVKYNDWANLWYSSKSNYSYKIEIKNKIEVLFINGIYSLRYNLIPLIFVKASRKIVSVRGMLHPGALSQKGLKKKIYLFLWKLFGLHKKCDFHASTQEEKKYIENVFGKKVKIFVASNFPRIFKRQLFPKKETGSLQLISIGLISPMKNYLKVIDALKTCNENISYAIYGPVKDQVYWNTCLEQIKKLPGNITVDYKGDISPDKVESALANSHVFILPSKSENFGHAIYEALSAGRPVITSNNTPWQNLEQSKAGINVSPENEHELTEAIQYFAQMDEYALEEWSIGANKYSASAINIEEIKEQYKEMFFDCNK